MGKIIILLVVGLMISCTDQVHEMSQSVDEMVVQMAEAQHQLSIEMANAHRVLQVPGVILAGIH